METVAVVFPLVRFGSGVFPQAKHTDKGGEFAAFVVAAAVLFAAESSKVAGLVAPDELSRVGMSANTAVVVAAAFLY